MTLMPHLASLTWDEDDRLRSTARQAASGGGTPQTAYYVYDASGQRVRKATDQQAAGGQVATRKAERIYLGAVEIYREYAADGTTITLERETLHVSDGGTTIALVETRTTGTDKAPAQLVRYQHGNHLGSAVLELDDGSNIISYEEYFPFGATSYQAVASQTDLPKRYRYTGKERDEENDLNYHGARYYAPWLGRWTSCDPLGLRPSRAAQLSLYAPMALNPICFIDLNGAEPQKPPIPGGFIRFVQKLGEIVAVAIGLHGTPNAHAPKLENPPLRQKPASVVKRDEELEKERIRRGNAKKVAGGDGGKPPAEPEDTRIATVKDIQEGLRWADAQGKAKPVPVEEPLPESPAKPLSGGNVATIAISALMVGGVLSSNASASEKAQQLAESYVFGQVTEGVTNAIVGEELGAILAVPIGFVVFMPSDRAGYEQEQARAQAAAERYSEIRGRAFMIMFSTWASGSVGDWRFAYEQAVHEEYVALGLGKAQQNCDATQACCAHTIMPSGLIDAQHGIYSGPVHSGPQMRPAGN
jgi:RHS repeat-associated protein